MSVHRSPPDTQRLTSPSHHKSDTALNFMSHTSAVDDFNYITKRQKRSHDEAMDDSVPSNSEIKSMFLELRSQQDSKFELVNNVLLTIMAQNKDIQNTIETMAGKHEQLLDRISVLEQENTDYKNRIIALEHKVETLEKYTRNSAIEIRNLPKHKEENKGDLIEIVQKIGAVIGIEKSIETNDIRDIFRTRSETIVVDFTTVLQKESVLTKCKAFNKNKRNNKQPLLHSEHLMLPGPLRPVYLAEYLSTKTRRLLYIAREYVRSKQLVAAWISFGKLLIKKEESSTPVRVNEESEIHKIVL
ncbi:hypothetical protein ABMA28_004210 [Loxostege sticticalis]|uniref:FP protein C-terminal domain-containing protein n=1 Tax=Loxostege sticticalis TaxID=481309 RepID=A0ABD0SUK9_LOXSC